MSAPPTRPLFVFGTLRDADVREVVLAHAPPAPRPAVLHGQRAVRLPDEAYPVLAPAAGARLGGLLLYLGAESLDRVAFYEGDEYGFECTTVEAAHGIAVEALVCADRAGRAAARVPWSLEEWQRHHKAAFLPLMRRYMALYGRMSIDEADRVWRAMTAGG